MQITISPDDGASQEHSYLTPGALLLFLSLNILTRGIRLFIIPNAISTVCPIITGWMLQFLSMKISGLKRCGREAGRSQSSMCTDGIMCILNIMPRKTAGFIKTPGMPACISFTLLVFHCRRSLTILFSCLLYTSDAADDLLCVDLG